jgi:hypothetical protein
MAPRTLESLLLGEGLIDEHSLSLARAEAIARQRKLAEIVIDLGLLDQRSLATLVARAAEVELVTPIDARAARSLVAMVPTTVARRHLVVPVRHDSEGLLVAMIDPFEPGIVELIESGSGVPVRKAVGVRSEIEMAVLELYHIEDEADRTIQISAALSLDLEPATAPADGESPGIPEEWGTAPGEPDRHDPTPGVEADRTAPSTAGRLSDADRLAHVERQLVSVTRMLAIIQSRLDTIDARLANLAASPRTTT